MADGDRWFGLDRLDRDAYGIFCDHLLWFAVARQVLGLPSVEGEFGALPLLQVGEPVVAAGFSLVVITAVRRAIDRRAAARLLGF